MWIIRAANCCPEYVEFIMHELSIATELVARAEETRKLEGAERVIRVAIRVGTLSGVDARALEMAFRFAAENTGTAGARLEIEEVSVGLSCGVCGETTIAQLPFMACGNCGSGRVQTVAGRELIIKTVTLE